MHGNRIALQGKGKSSEKGKKGSDYGKGKSRDDKGKGKGKDKGKTSKSRDYYQDDYSYGQSPLSASVATVSLRKFCGFAHTPAYDMCLHGPEARAKESPDTPVMIQVMMITATEARARERARARARAPRRRSWFICLSWS